jgi:tRNA-dihydrouridine synthase 2
MEKWNIRLDYSNKTILAPMVRVGTLPFRLMCLRYGADIVYGEELVTYAMRGVTRVENEVLNTVDFLKPDGSVIYRTCDEDVPNVFQLGASNAVDALAAASIVARDVVGIDLNMGCPKKFSTSGGMGSALLEQPETVRDILGTLVRNLPNNITCKVRLKSTTEDTIQLLKICESTGVKAMAIHARTKEESPSDKFPCHWDRVKQVIEQGNFSVPIIANGDVFTHEAIHEAREQTGASSIMIARGASRNPSIFQNLTQPENLDLVREYVKTSIDFHNFFSNTKYTATYMIHDKRWMSNSVQGKKVIQSKSYEDMCTGLNILDYWESSQMKQLESEALGEPPKKKRRIEVESENTESTQ